MPLNPKPHFLSSSYSISQVSTNQSGAVFSAKTMGRKSKQKQKIILPPELPPEVPEDEIEVSDEDLQFVNENVDYAGFVSGLDTTSITK